MSLCVALAPDGSLVPTGETVDACSGYVLVSGSEYSLIQAINTAFLAVPDAVTLSGWAVGPCVLIVTVYLAARFAGSIVNVFGR